jgi:hypothetical protein
LTVAVLIFLVIGLASAALLRLRLLRTGLTAMLTLPMLSRLTAVLPLSWLPTMLALAALLTFFLHIVWHELLLLRAAHPRKDKIYPRNLVAEITGGVGMETMC